MVTLAEIRDDIVDEKVPLATPMRKAKVLAFRLQNEILKQWVDWELSGYPESCNELPSYRIVDTQLCGDGISGYTVFSNYPLPHDSTHKLRFTLGIGTLEDALKENSEGSIGMRWSQEAIAHLNARQSSFTEFHNVIGVFLDPY